MSLNSSSNNFSHHDGSDSNDSSLLFYMYCATTPPSSTIFLLYNIFCILIIFPVCVFVIYLGLQRWRLQRSSSAATAMSHSDSFTFNMVAVELIGVFGNILSCCSVFGNLTALWVGSLCTSFSWLGQMPFIALTCLEHYLAVIHPIAYLSLKTERGVRIRNITNGCVWLLNFIILWPSVFVSDVFNVFPVVYSCVICSFCSFAVLFALTRQGLGGQGGDRDRGSRSKQRAFYILTIVTGILLIRFVGDLLWVGLFGLQKGAGCFILMVLHWTNMPCSLVLPALFIHRLGKLCVCCKNSSQDEDG